MLAIVYLLARLAIIILFCQPSYPGPTTFIAIIIIRGYALVHALPPFMRISPPKKQRGKIYL